VRYTAAWISAHQPIAVAASTKPVTMRRMGPKAMRRAARAGYTQRLRMGIATTMANGLLL
jgi:hypothetical protein